MQRKKIIVLSGHAPSLVNFRFHLLLKFKQLNYQVIACAPQYDANVKQKLNENGIIFKQIKFNPTSVNPIADFVFLLKLIKFFKRERPFILFSYMIKPVIYGSLAGKFVGISKIFSFITGLGYTFVGTSLKQKFISIFSNNLYALAMKSNSVVFFQNNDDMNLFKEKKIIPKKLKVKIINGSGVDLQHFYYVNTFPSKPTFLLVARLLKSKGILEYLEAAKIVKKKYPFTKFLLVGYFYQSPDVVDKKIVYNYNKEKIIEFLGKLSDVRPAIKNSSVYVLPSYREGTPRSVLEAMSMGRPIITTNAPGCKETVINNENGFLVKLKDPVSLANAMERFIKEPELIIQMGKRSREIAEQKYDVHNINKNIITEMQI